MTEHRDRLPVALVLGGSRGLGLLLARGLTVMGRRAAERNNEEPRAA